MLIHQFTHPDTSEVFAPEFTCSDKFGQVSIHKIENIIVTQFAGPCGRSLVAHYTKELENIVSQFNGQPWGYLSISEKFEAATVEAIEELAKSFYLSVQQGCVADAYVITSIMGQAQIKKMRSQFPVNASFEEVLFHSFDEAFASLSQKLHTLS